MAQPRIISAGLSLLTVAIALPSLALASTTVSDTTFDNGEWTLVTAMSGNGGSVVAAQSSIGPNFIRNVSNTVGANPSLIVGVHVYTPYVYTPSILGPLTDLSYSESAICLSGCTGLGQRTGPAIRQSGLVYMYNNLASRTGAGTSFHTIAWSNLTKDDFALVAPNATTGVYFDNAQHPDFSSSGGPIEFGFFRANGNTTGGGYTLDAGIDDWEITINSDAGTLGCCGDTGCPCANDGATCQGCGNSVNGMGAVLSATGLPNSEYPAFVALPDTVRFTASGMPATAAGILFKGTSRLPPVRFGDGLRCCGGTLKRLAVQNAVGGTISFGYPTQKVSVVGQSPAGEHACYQMYYRDPSPAFCPVQTFNVTNSYLIDWL